MALTQVTSAGLKDGEIVNADLHSAAAIAVSKLSGVLPLAGGVMTGSLRLNDNLELQLGSSGSDLKIYHNGTDTIITNATGDLYINNTGGNSDDIIIKTIDDIKLQVNDGEDGIQVHSNGAVDLYYDNTKMLETISTGNGGAKIKNINIYYSASGNGVIQNTAGNLYVEATSGESSALFKANGAVELYYDNAKKLETTGSGIAMAGVENAGAQIKVGASNDIQIEHDGSNSYFTNSTGNLGIQSDTLHLQSKAGGEYFFKAVKDGAVELYYDNSKKLETYSGGVSITGNYLFHGDSVETRWGGGSDLQIFHDGTQSIIQTNSSATKPLHIKGDPIWFYKTGGSELFCKMIADNAVELYFDNTKRFETASYGAQVFGNLVVGTDGGELLLTNPDGYSPKLKENAGHLEFWTNNAKRMNLSDGGDLQFNDSRKIELGSSQDLQIYHDAANVIESHNGYTLYLNKANTENMATFAPDGACKLFYDNVTRLETVSYGIRVSGHYYANDNFDVRLGTGSDMKLYHDGTDSFLANTTGSLTIKNTGNINLYTNDNEDAVVCTANGKVALYFDNAMKIETKTNGVTIQGDIGFVAAGNGLDFGANSHASGMSSEKFDVYEEGTWTPTVHDGTISTLYATYRKIGKQVTVWAYIYNFSDRSTNDLVRVKNLPYAPLSSIDQLGGSVLGAYCSGSLVHSAYVWSGNQVQFYGTGSGGYEQLRHNELNSGSSAMYFFCTYAVA